MLEHLVSTFFIDSKSSDIHFISLIYNSLIRNNTKKTTMTLLLQIYCFICCNKRKLKIPDLALKGRKDFHRARPWMTQID